MALLHIYDVRQCLAHGFPRAVVVKCCTPDKSLLVYGMRVGVPLYLFSGQFVWMQYEAIFLCACGYFVGGCQHCCRPCPDGFEKARSEMHTDSYLLRVLNGYTMPGQLVHGDLARIQRKINVSTDYG